MRRLTAFAATAGAFALMIAGSATPANDSRLQDGEAAVPVPIAPGAATDPIISTGDIVGGYQMSGIPDGLGAFKDAGDTLQVFEPRARDHVPGSSRGRHADLAIDAQPGDPRRGRRPVPLHRRRGLRALLLVDARDDQQARRTT